LLFQQACPSMAFFLIHTILQSLFTKFCLSIRHHFVLAHTYLTPCWCQRGSSPRCPWSDAGSDSARFAQMTALSSLKGPFHQIWFAQKCHDCKGLGEDRWLLFFLNADGVLKQPTLNAY
jgi:hypothetical protein